MPIAHSSILRINFEQIKENLLFQTFKNKTKRIINTQTHNLLGLCNIEFWWVELWCIILHQLYLNAVLLVMIVGDVITCPLPIIIHHRWPHWDWCPAAAEAPCHHAQHLSILLTAQAHVWTPRIVHKKMQTIHWNRNSKLDWSRLGQAKKD